MVLEKASLFSKSLLYTICNPRVSKSEVEKLVAQGKWKEIGLV